MNDSGTSKQLTETLQQFCQRILPVVQAGAEGKAIEAKAAMTGWERKSHPSFGSRVEYRVAQPKATPLPITPEMWAMIDPKYKFAFLSDGIVMVSKVKPLWVGESHARARGWSCKFSEYCKLPLAIDTSEIVPELSMTERPNYVASDNKRKLLFVKQDRLLDIYADFLREAGATQDNHVDATHYAESMTGDHVDLYKKMPDKWIIWNYNLRLWHPVQIFGAEPNPIK